MATLSKTWSGKRPHSFDKHLLLQLVLVVLGSILTTISITAAEYAWAVWIGLLPLFIAIRLFSPLWATLSGGVWGLGILMASHFVIGADFQIPFTLSNAALLTTVPAVYACLGGLISHLIGFRPLLLALGWIGVELALKTAGIHNGLFAPANGSRTATLLIGGILGYSFIGFLIVFTGAFLLDFACVAHFRPLRFTYWSPICQTLLASPLENTSTGFASVMPQPTKPRAPPALLA